MSDRHRRAVKMAAAMTGLRIGEFAELVIEGNESAIEIVKECLKSDSE